MTTNWYQFYMMISYCLAIKLKDLSTTVRCVSIGLDNVTRTPSYNNFVRGWYNIKNLEHLYEYYITEHNAIPNGIKTENINNVWVELRNTERETFKAGNVSIRCWSSKISEMPGLLNGKHINLLDL